MLYFIIKITSVSSDFTETTVLNRNTIHNTRECVETEADTPWVDSMGYFVCPVGDPCLHTVGTCAFSISFTQLFQTSLLYSRCCTRHGVSMLYPCWPMLYPCCTHVVPNTQSQHPGNKVENAPPGYNVSCKPLSSLNSVPVQATQCTYSTGNTVHLQYRQHCALTVQATQCTYSTGNTVHLQYRQHSALTVQATLCTYSTGNTVHLQYRQHSALTVQATLCTYSTGNTVHLQYRQHCALTVQATQCTYSTGNTVHLQYRQHSALTVQATQCTYSTGNTVHLQYRQHSALTVQATQCTYSTGNTVHLQYRQHSALTVQATQCTYSTGNTVHLQYRQHSALAFPIIRHIAVTAEQPDYWRWYKWDLTVSFLLELTIFLEHIHSDK